MRLFVTFDSSMNPEKSRSTTISNIDNKS